MADDDGRVHPAPRNLRDGDPDATGLIEAHRIRLADFLDEGEPLPFGFLLVVSGPARGQTIVIEQLPAVIGRSDDVELQVLDDTVSRRHAQLLGDREAGISVLDVGSANGTLLNGHSIVGQLHLRDGDLLELGSAVLLVKLIN